MVADPRFADVVKNLRHDNGLSLRELASLVHYSHTYLWDIERGRKQPTPEMAAALDNALNAGGALAALVTDEAPSDAVDPTPLTGALHLLDTNRHHLEDVARQAWSGGNPSMRVAAAQFAQFASWLYDTFVRSRPPLVRLGAGRYSRRVREEAGVSPFRTEVSKQGRSARVECRSVSRQPPPPDVADRLMIARDDTVIRRENLYYADDEPVQISVTYIPLTVAGTSTLVTTKALGRGSLYSRLADLGYEATRVREQVRSRLPAPEEADSLRIPPGVPVLEILHTSYDDHDQPFEATRFTIRADLVVIDYEMPIAD